MSDVVTFVSSLTPTLGVILVFITSLLTYKQSLKNHDQGEKIHVLVNSNLTAVKTDLALALDRVAKLEAMIVDLRQVQRLGRDE